MTKLPQDQNNVKVRDLRNGEWLWMNRVVLEHPNLRSSEKLVYAALAFFANNTTQGCFPSITKISELTTLHQDTVTKAIKTLEREGFIGVTRRAGKVNYYNLLKVMVTQWHERVTPRKNHTTPKSRGAPPENNGVDHPETEGSNNTNKQNLSNKTNIYSSIFEVWNEQNVITHRSLTDKMKRAINGRLKEKYTPEEICQAIKNYAEIVRDERYYFKYKWTLQHFMQRGFDRFTDLETAKNNFKRGGVFNGVNQRDFTKEDYTGGKYGGRVGKG